ncbi:uncharacterized protein BP5553_00307 [Venustampulla echinocandica]|uniref:Uncharacterized protein n=1 Tax=Venustampulla echinocandica TaxID=2656787 RepID=A0A370TXU8_9HELO|nr:uncharacterized protein BP5553_00307 [Venustampulla echinocandica]RDL40328.1 hypothetical protein BP5553_00307 [Venustampulla echinocandica]
MTKIKSQWRGEELAVAPPACWAAGQRKTPTGQGATGSNPSAATGPKFQASSAVLQASQAVQKRTVCWATNTLIMPVSNGDLSAVGAGSLAATITSARFLWIWCSRWSA